MVLGPVRVFPGRLSVRGKNNLKVSRTFGDIEAKLEKYGGNPKVVIAEPDIINFQLNENADFVILASNNKY